MIPDAFKGLKPGDHVKGPSVTPRTVLLVTELGVMAVQDATGSTGDVRFHPWHQLTAPEKPKAKPGVWYSRTKATNDLLLYGIGQADGRVVVAIIGGPKTGSQSFMEEFGPQWTEVPL